MFPIVLNLENKVAVVFGGGKVAERRIVKLLEGGAEVKVISKEFTKTLEKLKNPNLELISEELKDITKFIETADVVLIATNDKDLNDRIERECKKCKKMTNRADKVSDFIIPATIKIGDALISVSTKGKSPAVSKLIKKRIKKVVTQEDMILIELQEFLRGRLKNKVGNQAERKKILREIINTPEVAQCLRSGNLEKAKSIASDYLEDR